MRAFPACRLKIGNNSLRRTKRSHKLPSHHPISPPFTRTPQSPPPTPHPERQPHRCGPREPSRNTCSAPSNVLQLPSTKTHRVPGQDHRHRLPTATPSRGRSPQKAAAAAQPRPSTPRPRRRQATGSPRPPAPPSRP